jgi:APA family basic amino acid/polyamine antiporter
MLNLTVATWVRFVVWMLIGFVVYFAYGRSHSRFADSGVNSSGDDVATSSDS